MEGGGQRILMDDDDDMMPHPSKNPDAAKPDTTDKPIE